MVPNSNMVHLIDYTSVLSRSNSDSDTRLCSWCEISYYYNAEREKSCWENWSPQVIDCELIVER